ncbi:MAG: DUF3667 domain-containing protein [Flavobacterium sp.]
MAHKNPLRKDKTCLNCNHVVAERFCPNCGQENTDTRKTFFHLFVHFFEDLTHYENAFWKTIKNLILKPSSLTKEYLSGKRMSYLAPVRLYIFISFVTFFLITVFPNEGDDFVKINNGKYKKEKKDIVDKKNLSAEESKIIELKEKGILSQQVSDSLRKLIKESKEKSPNKDFTAFGYHSVKEMDSIRAIHPNDISDLVYWLNKKAFAVFKNNTKEQIIEKAKESAMHNFPKVLLLYMPLFAFFLWLFHNKKRWYFFDHGIFTLHYFSFLLSIMLLLFLSKKIVGMFYNYAVISVIVNLIEFVGFVWMFCYFFPAHHRFYGEIRIISFIKSMFLFFINIFFIVIFLIIFFVYTLISIH